jgi:hypothetical protein
MAPFAIVQFGARHIAIFHYAPKIIDLLRAVLGCANPKRELISLE